MGFVAMPRRSLMARQKPKPAPEGFRPIEVEVYSDPKFAPIEVAAPVADNTKTPGTGKED